MKIIDAFWEKRNLGISATEINVSNDDLTDDVIKQIKDITSEYIVVKCPVSKVDLYFELTKQGFTFIETSLNVISNLKDVNIDKIQQRISDSVSYLEMDKSDIEILNSEIDKGLFYTDRVVLDPNFTSAQASNRYKCWIQDEVKKGSQLYKLIYKNNTIGFFIFKKIDDGVFYPFLAGLYKEYQKSSFGGMFILKPIEEAIKRNGKIISTYISTNNLNAIKAHLNLGFKVNDMEYVFVKHNESA